MSNENVTIIMPVRNSAAFIEEAILSVANQTYKNWNLLVIDDASMDETVAIVSKMAIADQRIKLLLQKEHVGVAKARNIGLDHAGKSLIAFLDSDDIWHSEKLKTQVKFMNRTGTAITYGAYQRINSKGKVIGYVTPPTEVDFQLMLRSNFIGNLTAIFNRNIFPEIKFNDIGNEDYKFWLDCLKQFDKKVQATPSDFPLAKYRVGRRSLSSNKFRSAYWQWQIYTKHLNFGVLKSSLSMAIYLFYGIRKRYSGERWN